MKHGTRAKYIMDRCRCDAGKRANTQYQIPYMKQRRRIAAQERRAAAKRRSK